MLRNKEKKNTFIKVEEIELIIELIKKHKNNSLKRLLELWNCVVYSNLKLKKINKGKLRISNQKTAQKSKFFEKTGFALFIFLGFFTFSHIY